jgi:hypothetical protein
MITILITYTEGGAKGQYIEQPMNLQYCDRLTPSWARIAALKLFNLDLNFPENLTVWENPPWLTPGTYTGYRIFARSARKLKRIIKEPYEGGTSQLQHTPAWITFKSEEQGE